MATEFKLPALGENVDSGTVVQLLVAVGDQIEADQSILELETGKSVMEVPSSVSGTIKEILAKAGDTVKVGQAILTVEGAQTGPGAAQEAGAASAAKAAPTSSASAKGEANGVSAASTAPPATTTVATPPAQSNGVASNGSSPADSNGAASGALPAGAASSPVPGPAASTNGTPPTKTETLVQDAAPISHDPVPAAPSIRRLARELGVDIHAVKGSGTGGRISEEDVKQHAKRIITQAAQAASASAPATTGGVPAIALPDFTKWGEVERQTMSGVRRATADHMARSWASVPHVTQFDKADITELEGLRKRYAKQVEAAGGKLTVTAIILKVIVAALRRFPQFNSSLDLGANELVLKKYYHVGVAVDTGSGLLVPIIRDVDKKNVIELAVELGQMAEKARSRKTTLDEMQGGCFTVTNLGGIGGVGFTPIVNAPEVAILGLARASQEPVYQDGQFEPRLMLPLALSYDHRVIDGADGARFLRWIVNALEQPFLMSLEG